jgi:hypothetical protein
MRPDRNQVSRRLDRVMRVQLVGAVLLALGVAAFLLGIGLVFITFHYTPEQLATVTAAKPWTTNVFLFLPAAAHFRPLGGVLVLVGVVLFGLGNLVRDERW